MHQPQHVALATASVAWRRLSVGAAVLVVLLATLLRPVPVEAQSGSVALGQGVWQGSKGAAGVLTHSGPEGSVLWIGDLTGSSLFVVAAGSSSGTWNWVGDVDMTVTTPQGEVPIELQSVASGSLSGSGSGFTLSGEQTTTGSGSFMGVTTDIGVNVAPVDPFEVRFVDASCWHAFGDWTTSMNEVAASEGFSGQLTGWYIASPLGEVGEDPLVAQELTARYEAIEAELRALLSPSDGRRMSGAALVDALPLIDEATRLEAEAAELQRTCAFADGNALFATPLTSTIASLVLAMASTLDPGQLFNATVLLVNVGGAGEAASQVVAAQLERALADQAQMWHDTYVTTSGVHADGRPCSVAAPCMLDQSSVIQLHVTADMLGVPLTVDGVPVSLDTLLSAGVAG